MLAAQQDEMRTMVATLMQGLMAAPPPPPPEPEPEQDSERTLAGGWVAN